ncbi:MAG: hypothetical protein NT104_05670 [Bacteroidetes bacterium]|nr:hypothetical protein [Bacteroidota bacterium]
MFLKKLGVYIVFGFAVFSLKAQPIWENPNAKVYSYLSRMAQKGMVEFDDIIQPVSRDKITQALKTIAFKKAQLSIIELEELNFYLQEYPISRSNLNNSDTAIINFLVKDNYARWRTLNLQAKDYSFNIDPIIADKIILGNGNNINQVSNGIQLWGTAGKHIGYQLFYRDYTEKGTVRNYYTVNVLSFKREDPTTAIILVGLNDDRKINYSEIRANINYSFNKGMLSFGKDRMLWGYGENGRIVMSDYAPTYPYLRFDYEPIKNLHFNYLHAWLNSNMVDSNASYLTHTGGVSGDVRVLYKPKFLATHSISFKPKLGLDISIGESIVYSDKMDPGFLIPINIFKVYDNNKSNYLINAGSNSQLFFQLSSRNQIKNTHLYATVFIDELRVATMFDSKKSRNQLGLTMGASTADKFVSNLTLGGEYTWVNPFVYSNLIPAQYYTQYDYSIGDWMGNNFDRLLFYGKYTPKPRLHLYAHLQRIRKGGPGTILQQYTAEPQPKFLFEFQKNRFEILLKADYELVNNLYLFSSTQFIHSVSYNKKTTDEPIFQLGFSYGLP